MNRKFWQIMALGAILFGLVPVAAAQTNGRLLVTMSRETAVLMAGDWVEFTTTLRNDGAAATPPLVAHLSVTAVDTDRHVDPEDWSPQRTQFLPPLPPGESVALHWQLHALFEGEFAAFVTIVAKDGTSAPAMGTPLRVQVSPDNILPLEAVIPVAAIVPFFPLALLVFSVAKSRRRTG